MFTRRELEKLARERGKEFVILTTSDGREVPYIENGMETDPIESEECERLGLTDVAPVEELKQWLGEDYDWESASAWDEATFVECLEEAAFRSKPENEEWFTRNTKEEVAAILRRVEKKQWDALGIDGYKKPASGYEWNKQREIGENADNDTIFRNAIMQWFGEEVQSISDIVDDVEKNKVGIDREVVLKSGRVLNIEQKNSRFYSTHFFAELIGDVARNTPGWTVDPNKQSDFIFYYWEKAKKMLVLPAYSLRRAVRRMAKQYGEEYGLSTTCSTVKETGRRWETVGVSVPTEVLLHDMHNEHTLFDC